MRGLNERGYFSSGRYSGMHISVILQKDPGYVAWCYETQANHFGIPEGMYRALKDMLAVKARVEAGAREIRKAGACMAAAKPGGPPGNSARMGGGGGVSFDTDPRNGSGGVSSAWVGGGGGYYGGGRGGGSSTLGRPWPGVVGDSTAPYDYSSGGGMLRHHNCRSVELDVSGPQSMPGEGSLSFLDGGDDEVDGGLVDSLLAEDCPEFTMDGGYAGGEVPDGYGMGD